MAKSWLTVIAGFVLVVTIGFVALNYDKPDNATQRLFTESSSSEIDASENISPEYNTVSEQQFESQSERTEALLKADLQQLNKEIEATKRKLDKETAIAQSRQESPEQVLAEASMILSELEKQGIEVTYSPVLLTPDNPSPLIEAIENQIVEVENDLIDIERRFNNLGNNKESL